MKLKTIQFIITSILFISVLSHRKNEPKLGGSGEKGYVGNTIFIEQQKFEGIFSIYPYDFIIKNAHPDTFCLKYNQKMHQLVQKYPFFGEEADNNYCIPLRFIKSANCKEKKFIIKISIPNNKTDYQLSLINQTQVNIFGNGIIKKNDCNTIHFHIEEAGKYQNQKFQSLKEKLKYLSSILSNYGNDFKKTNIANDISKITAERSLLEKTIKNLYHKLVNGTLGKEILWKKEHKNLFETIESFLEFYRDNINKFIILPDGLSIIDKKEDSNSRNSSEEYSKEINLVTYKQRVVEKAIRKIRFLMKNHSTDILNEIEALSKKKVQEETIEKMKKLGEKIITK